MIDFNEIEQKWNKYWSDNDIYRVDNDSPLPKFYVLDMFPYPSGAGLHVGHPLGYIASDIYARRKRMQGFNVLHPMGFDAFGLPAEEFALKTGIHPEISTSNNMARYRKQLKSLGFSFDWSREVVTCDPEYYKWTQYIFTLLFNHYYDQQADKALPISDLVGIFEKEGNSKIMASTSYKDSFNSDQWNSYSRVEKEEVLMNYRLAYKKVGYVNWCEELGTVLANDQIKDGVTERGGYPVVQKAMTQWYLRITAYADRLLSGLNQVEWSNSLKAMQTNWIGKSEGASIFFKIVDSEKTIEIFTTRPDTIYGASYMVLAPEHDLVKELTTSEQAEAVKNYIDYVASKSEVDRMSEKQVTGAFVGTYALNPFTNQHIPIWIGEYVLKDYGTGAIMAVPSDDERDLAFATKYGLEIIDVVDKSKYPHATLHDKLGVMINSDFLNGMEVPDAIKVACQKVEEMGIGKTVANYKMRDAGFSRQRYWGEPFPVYYDEEGVAHVYDLKSLPIELPFTDNFKPARDGSSPLSRLTEWVHMSNGHRRETDTMPAVAGSSWYYLRYMDPENKHHIVSPEAIQYWQDVDLYVGGAEHAVAHLLYARFWHKFLKDIGKVHSEEPFKKLINQGMIQGIIESIYLDKNSPENERVFYSADLVEEMTDKSFARISVHIDFVSRYGNADSHLSVDGIKAFREWSPSFDNAVFVTPNARYHNGVIIEGSDDDFQFMTHSEIGKMSKSLFNVINPETVTAKYGTDCFRMYEMFLGPIEQAKPWDTNGIDGVSKFLRKFIDLFYSNDSLQISDETPSKEEYRILHTAIKKVNDGIDQFSYNTCVSAMMICINDLRKVNCNKREVLDNLVRLIAPFAPFLAEELWSILGHAPSVHKANYPVAVEEHLVTDTVSYPICINGKKRGLMDFDKSATNKQIEDIVLQQDYVLKWLEGSNPKKVIVVPGRMVNIVI